MYTYTLYILCNLDIIFFTKYIDLTLNNSSSVLFKKKRLGLGRQLFRQAQAL